MAGLGSVRVAISKPVKMVQMTVESSVGTDPYILLLFLLEVLLGHLNEDLLNSLTDE